MSDPIERLRRKAQNETTALALNKLLHLAGDEIDLLRAERDALVKEDEIKAGVNRALLAEIERLRAVLVAAKGLNAESEEYDFDYGLGRAAPNSYWEELDDAIEAIDAVIAQADAALGSEG